MFEQLTNFVEKIASLARLLFTANSFDYRFSSEPQIETSKSQWSSTSDAQELLKLNQTKKYLQKRKNGDYSTYEKIHQKRPC